MTPAMMTETVPTRARDQELEARREAMGWARRALLALILTRRLDEWSMASVRAVAEALGPNNPRLFPGGMTEIDRHFGNLEGGRP